MSVEKSNKYYVYLLIDSSNNEIFYVGKGIGKRAESHIKNYRGQRISNIFRHKRIESILRSGNEVLIKYHAENLSEGLAFKIEGELIRSIGTKNLTNIMGGSKKPTQSEIAKHHLSRAMPFNEWVKKYNPSEHYKKIYWDITAAFTKIANYSG